MKNIKIISIGQVHIMELGKTFKNGDVVELKDNIADNLVSMGLAIELPMEKKQSNHKPKKEYE